MFKTVQKNEFSRRQGAEPYSFSNPLLVYTMRGVDGLLSFLSGTRDQKGPLQPPRRILIANAAALGDVLIATSILPHLRTALPGVEIGFLVGTWAKSIVANHPCIDHVHFIDSPFMNRSSASVAAKVWRGVRSAYSGIRGIRRVQYDAVVDLHYNLGNYASILWLTGIPNRIGYVSGGFGPLLTEKHVWKKLPQPIALANAQLFQCFGVKIPPVGMLKSVLPTVASASREKVDHLLQEHGLVKGTYVVAHVGTGAQFREWPNSNWREVISTLTSSGIRVVCTGSGAREQQIIRESCGGLKGVVDLCDAITFTEYFEVVRRAALLLGVESLSGHVAAAASVPSVQIYSGIFELETWRPLNSMCTVLRHRTECAPCGRRGGCATMSCVRGVTPAQVLLATKKSLAQARVESQSSSQISVFVTS